MGNQSVTTNSNNPSSIIKTAMTEESQFLNYQSIRFVEESSPPISQEHQRCLQGKNLMIEFQKHNVQFWRENKIICKKQQLAFFIVFPDSTKTLIFSTPVGKTSHEISCFFGKVKLVVCKWIT